jgi:diguanylate cyclase (GGDEF)-like protein
MAYQPLPSTDRAGLATVAVGAALVSLTVVLLPVGNDARWLAWGTVASAVAVAALSAWLHLARRRRSLAALYPLTLFGSLAVMGGHTTTLGQVYSGFFTIGFLYVGLFLPRFSAAALSLPAALCWWASNGGFSGTSASILGVRLPIALSIWVGVAELLAARVSSTRDERRRLLDVSERDPLTGLYNRRCLPEVFASSRPGDAFVLVDFDHFKSVNDRMGHAAGDGVLTDFATVVQAMMRRDDTAVRYGGEEVLLHLRQPEREHVAMVLTRLREAWRRSSPLTTYSGGAAILAVEETAQHAIARADDLLYTAKAAGRDRDVLQDSAVPMVLCRPEVDAARR